MPNPSDPTLITPTTPDLPESLANAPTEIMPPSVDAAAPTVQMPTAATGPSPGPRPTYQDPLLNQTVAGRYHIEEKIGEGGFGAVYRARDVQNQLGKRQVVLKFLKEKGLHSAWVVAKFKQEVEALARLDNHPGIVGLLDAGEHDGLPYIVLQYVDGEPLRQRIRPRGMELDEVAEIVRQTALALAEAHSHDILHRDLKPENVMLRRLGTSEISVTVIDFGVAKVRDSEVAFSSETGMVMGTYLYMSPEQLNGQNKTLTPASEVYALAVMAYEMLTGVLPFNARNVAQLSLLQQEGVKAKPCDLRPDLPAAAQKVLLRALSYNAADRYQSIKVCGDELARTLRAVELVPTPEPGPAPLPQPPPFAWRTPLIIAVGVVLAAVLGVAVWRSTTGHNEATGTPPQTVTAQAAPSSLAYSLTVQKVFGGKEMGGPQEYTGAEMFGNGWKFKFNLTPVQSGYFYLLNAGPLPDGGTEWNVLFPTPKNNQGQAQIAGGQRQTFGWYFFDKNTGQERLWLIWAAQPVAELETTVQEAAKSALVINNPAHLNALNAFLQAHEKDQVETVPDDNLKQTQLKSASPVWAYQVKLRHDKY